MCSTPRNCKTAVTAVKQTAQFSGRAQAIMDQGATGEEFVLGASMLTQRRMLRGLELAMLKFRCQAPQLLQAACA
jgi:hypothetical protein